MSGITSLNATRWLNESQKFVEVGTLIRDDTLDRKVPLIAFSYHPDYLKNNEMLLPSDIEQSRGGGTILSASEAEGMVPNYFKQFLPSERNKSLFNEINGEYHNLDQFQQIEYITQFRGVFGAVQLNYDSEHQSNKLPDINEAIKLLDQIESNNYHNIDKSLLSAMYHPNSDTHVVSTFIEMDGNHVYCTVKKCEDEKAANQMLFTQTMLNECGIESSLAIKLNQSGNDFYVGQVTGEQIIDLNNRTSLMFNTVPASVLMADSKAITHYETINFANINKVVQQVMGEEAGGEVFKRALFNHLMKQKDMTAQHFKLREVGAGEWSLSPQEVFAIDNDKDVPFGLPISDTISAYSNVVVDANLVEMAEKKYQIPKVLVEKAIAEISVGMKKVNEVALDSGLHLNDIKHLTTSIEQSGLFIYASNTSKNIDEERKPDEPTM